MAKFQNPNKTGIVYITQNYHGEDEKNPDDLSIQIGIDIRGNENDPRYSICNGIVEKITDGLNGYVSIIPDGLQSRVLHVHTKDFTVKEGQRVKAGDLLGYVRKPSSGGTHKHLGMKNLNGKAPQPQIMDYFDRSIIFRTTYQDIANDWFKGKIGGDIDWSLFKDLQYGNRYAKGDRLIALQDMNLRNSVGEISGTISKGAVCVVISDKLGELPESAGKYDFYNVEFLDRAGYVADTNFNEKTTNEVTNLDGTITSPNDPEITELKKQIDILNSSIESYKASQEAQKVQMKELADEIEELNKEIETQKATVSENEITIKKKDEDIEDLKAEVDKYKNLYEEAEANSLKSWLQKLLKTIFKS